MAEIDTNPLESVKDSLCIFEHKIDQERWNSICDVGNEDKEIHILSKELVNFSHLQALENLENESAKSENLSTQFQNVEAGRDSYVTEYLETQKYISELESDNQANKRKNLENLGDCSTLKRELALVKSEMKQTKLLEATYLMEKEKTTEALMKILLQNQANLSSSLAAMQAEKERCDLFQAMQVELCVAKESALQANEKLESMKLKFGEIDCLEKEIDHLQLELKQANELNATSIKEIESKHESEVDALKNEIEIAKAEISDLKFRLEEAMKRAELAEKAKIEVEYKLKNLSEKSKQKSFACQFPVLRVSRSASVGNERRFNRVPLGKFLYKKY